MRKSLSLATSGLQNWLERERLREDKYVERERERERERFRNIE
jgi:hypothetical protein